MHLLQWVVWFYIPLLVCSISHTFPPATDPEGDDIIYRMKFQNGSALDPSWITFDNTTLDLVYTVPDGSPQFINLVMQVADIYNPIVSEVVLLEVNDVPKLNTSISTVYSMISQRTHNNYNSWPLIYW